MFTIFGVRDQGISRRDVLRGTGTAGAAALAGCLGGDGGQEYIRPIDIEDLSSVEPENGLNVWNWYYQFRDWTVENFSEEHDIENTSSTGYTSAAEWYSRLESGDHQIDHVGSTGIYTVRAIENDYFEPLPVEQFAIWDRMPQYLKDTIDEYFSKDGDRYVLPQSVLVYPSLTYNEEHFDSPPESWGVLWEEDLADNMCMWDQAEYACQIAAFYTGQDPFDPDDLDEIQAVLEQQIDLNVTLWTEYNAARGLFINEDVVVGPLLDGQTYSARYDDEMPINYTVPEEGGLYQLDDWGIPTDCPNPRAATLFTEWATRPENFKQMFLQSGYMPAVKRNEYEDIFSQELDSGDITQEELDFFRWSDEWEERLIYAEPLSDDVLQSYDEIWNEVKSNA